MFLSLGNLPNNNFTSMNDSNNSSHIIKTLVRDCFPPQVCKLEYCLPMNKYIGRNIWGEFRFFLLVGELTRKL